MITSIEEVLKLKKIEFPQPFNQETVESIMNRIFTANPYHWHQPKNYLLMGSNDPLWLVKKWVEGAFELYQGSFLLSYPELSTDPDQAFFTESEARWNLAWDWSRALRELLPLIYWNADTWLNQHRFQLRKVDLTSTEMVLQKIQADSSSTIEREFRNLQHYYAYRDEREESSSHPFVRIRCGEFRTDQVYLGWGSDFMVFPFPSGEGEFSELECYYLKFNQSCLKLLTRVRDRFN